MIARDLFCGAGGASFGLHQAGFDVVGYDFWQPAIDTHNANGLPAHLHDLSDPALDGRLGLCDLMWLSPPCQPFSAAGEGEGEFDDRDGFPWALRIVAGWKPPVVIFENVKGLTFRKHRRYFSGVLEQLRTLGYHVENKVLNTADYGVPQTRERCIIIGRRDGRRILWPMPTHTEQAGMFTQRWVSMADALGWGMDRPSFTVLAGGTDTGGAEPFSNASPKVMWRLNTGRAWVKGGDRADAQTLPIDGPAPTVSAVPGQWWLTRPATTIAGDTRVFQPGGHHQPGEQSENAIRLTIPELATLQGFPPDWTWTGNLSQQAKQVGNAVPPTLARVLAEANLPS